MQLTDILSLKSEPESLNIIAEFLTKNLVQFEYERALLTYVKIANELEIFELGLKETTKYLKTIEDKKATKYRVNIYAELFIAALNIGDFKKAKEYILKRKELLPQLEQYKALLDEVELRKALKDDYLDVLLNLKREIIPKDILIHVNEELLNYYTDKRNYEKCEDIINDLFELTINYKYLNELVKIYYLEEKYELVISEVEKLISQNAHNLYSIVYYIASLRITKKFRKANSVEAEYENAIDNNLDNKFKTFAYNEIIKLYKEQNSQVSLKLYEDKLSKLKRVEKSKPELKTKEVIKVTEIKTSQVLRDAKYIEYFSWIKEWLLFSKNIKLNIPFREYLRQLFIEIDKKYQFSDVILYANNYFESNFFHYKKGRLYDKKVIDFYIENTIIRETLELKKAVFGDPEYLNSTKDVLTQKTSLDDIKYLYAIYINKDTVLTFYLDEVIKDPGLIYELLSGISIIINLRLLDEVNNKTLNNESKYLKDIINNPVMPMRRMTIGRSSYNKGAVDLFNIDPKLHIELFLREVDLEDAKNYQKVIERLFNYPNETNVIKYRYQDLIILEYLFAVKINEEVTIFSYFIDTTKHHLKTEELNYKANYDKETKLLNKSAFENDFNNFIEDKTTFVLLNLDQGLRSIYGNERMNKFFLEFAQATRKHFTDDKIYRYDFNQILLVLNINDVRTVNKVLSNYFSVINHLESNVLKFEEFKVNAGVLRYPVVTSEKNIDKIYRYLDIALLKSLQNKQNFIDFTFSYYEEDIFEQQVIDYLNEAINNKKLNIRFNQIIDKSKNVVKNYESEIFLPNLNIDNKYLINIAKKRNKLVDLEYFHIEFVASFLHMLEKETNYFLNVIIPISKETFLSNEFENHFTAVLKKYEIPAKFVKILVDINLTKQKDLARTQRLIKYGITLETTNINTALNSEFKALHINYNNSAKWKDYYNLLNKMLANYNIDLIIRNVNSNEDSNQLVKLGVNFIEGDIYRKISVSELIEQVKGNLNENN